VKKKPESFRILYVRGSISFRTEKADGVSSMLSVVLDLVLIARFPCEEGLVIQSAPNEVE
jgi:hypothetical protein